MVRALCVYVALFVVMVGCGSCYTAPENARPPAPAPASAAAEDGTTVVVIDGRPVRIDAPPAGETGEAWTGEGPAPIDEPQCAPPARPSRPVKTVVVDPGHGGENTGATAGALEEKEINLDVALRLAAALRKRGIGVTLTRSDDTFLALEERAEVANAAQADLFISIHSNAAANPDASGIEVFFPAEIFRRNSQVYDDASRASELNVRNLPEGPLSYDGDPGGAVSAARLALSRDQARTLAMEIERTMADRLQAPSRGVKPQSYEVLRSAVVPAVLVEVGFLTNDDDRGKLCDADYRQRVADALADAIAAYSRLAEPAR